VAFPKDQKSSTSKDPLATKVAQAYGVSSFSKVKSIEFTFNVDFGKNRKVARSWIWDPQTNQVTYDGPGQDGKEMKYSYNRNKLDTSNKKEKSIDAKFINDSYWLLFPFHLAWDNNVNITNEGQKSLPIGNGKETMLTVQYENNVGYTPDDAFDLYINKNDMITEWVYRHGGSETHKAPFTWQDNKKFGNITISTSHYGADKKGKIWFSGVKVNFM
jgi:hypothetical protein